MKPLSERMAQKILDHDSTILLRPEISPEIQELVQLEAKIILLKDRVIFEQAWRIADCQNDYGLAAYALRDLKLTKDADLASLCQALHQETASEGDWKGLRDLWEKAYLDALSKAKGE